MTEDERNTLIEVINRNGLDSGHVVKVNGAWIVQGDAPQPEPVIKMPHWKEEGAGTAVIDGQVKK